jgi:hypothetical protein
MPALSRSQSCVQECHLLRLTSMVTLSTPPLFNVLYAWEIAH